MTDWQNLSRMIGSLKTATPLETGAIDPRGLLGELELVQNVIKASDLPDLDDLGADALERVTGPAPLRTGPAPGRCPVCQREF